MTLEEMKTYDKEYLTPEQVASVTGQDPQAIRIAARENPDWLRYPTYLSGRTGHTTRIPRLAFLKFMGVDV